MVILKTNIKPNKPFFFVIRIISTIKSKGGAVRVAKFRIKSGIVGNGKEISRLNIYPESFNFNFLYPVLRKTVAKYHCLVPEIRAILNPIIVSCFAVTKIKVVLWF